MRPLAILPVIALLLSACAQNDKPVTLKQPIKKIGIASSCGKIITRESLALFMVGLDDYSTREISAWGLDGSVKKIVSDRTGGAVAVTDVQADLDKITGWRGQSIFSSVTEADMLKSSIRPPIEQVDAYLVLTKGYYGENSTLTGPNSVNVRYGVGLFSRMNWFFAHVECNARLVDARTFEIIKQHTIHQFADADKDLNLDKWDDYTPEQMERVRKHLTALWEKSVSDMLTRMPL